MKYRWQCGTNRKIYYILSIVDEGKMSLTFHGTDRTIEYEVEIASDIWDGWLKYGKGSLLPPLDNPKWKQIDE